jgi:hypothetical protein
VPALHPDSTGPATPRPRPVMTCDRRLRTRPHRPGLGGWGRSRSPPDRSPEPPHLHDTSKECDARA